MAKKRSKSEEYGAASMSRTRRNMGGRGRKRVPFRSAAGGLGRKEGCEVGKGSNRSASIM